jgi:hypothetical protein
VRSAILATLALAGALAGLAPAPASAGGLALPMIAKLEPVDIAVPATAAQPETVCLAPGGPVEPTLLLAQRAIERSWGPSDDSLYVELDIPDWRSEGGAMALSGILPGSGQLYVGEKTRALVFAVAEIVGWTARALYIGRGDELRAESVTYAGNPADSASTWSFERWTDATDEDPAVMQSLYREDPEVFYDLIATESRFLSGWSGDPQETRSVFSDLRDHSDARYRYSRYASTALWINHLVSAYDALRSARNHNLPLRRNIDVRLKSGWKRGGPHFLAVVEARF